MKKLVCILLTCALLFCFTGCGKEETAAQTTLSEDLTYYADIVIRDYGTVTVQLCPEVAPITVENFITLAKSGFYDGLTFHRIIEGFMMQGGAPNGGKKAATIYGEFSENGWNNTLPHTRGTISMARSEVPDSASSQFFIVHEDSPHLNGKYAAFGYVVSGIEVVDAVCNSARPINGNGAIATEDQPIIDTVTIRSEA